MTTTKPTSSPKLVKVNWIDAAASIGWDDRNTQYHVHAIQSVGWLLTDDKTEIVLCADISTVDGRTDTNRRMAIPKSWVTKIKEIKH